MLERVEVFVDVAFLDDRFWFGAGSIGDVISGLASFLFGRSGKATIKTFPLESKPFSYYLHYMYLDNKKLSILETGMARNPWKNGGGGV